jgi:hypothetical protein
MEPLRLGPETDFAEALKKHPGLGAFGVGRELKRLSEILQPGEYVHDILQGTFANQGGCLFEQPFGSSSSASD